MADPEFVNNLLSLMSNRIFDVISYGGGSIDYYKISVLMKFIFIVFQYGVVKHFSFILYSWFSLKLTFLLEKINLYLRFPALYLLCN